MERTREPADDSDADARAVDDSAARRADPPLRLRAGLFGAVFVTGAAVMVIEILGTRLIGPVFGVSLFVWSALLAVTLAALAVGYYLGGRLVDRKPTPALPGIAAILAALCV